MYVLGEPVVKMGTTTEYGYTAPAGDTFPHFYSALIVSGRGVLGNLWYPELVKIEVSGKDPDGNPLSGDRFGDREVLVSPDDSGVEQTILKTIYDVLVSCLPTGLEEFVKNTISAGGGTTGQDETKAWGKWQRAYFGSIKKERGLRFRYALVVDPNLKGTYTINIHYHAWICALGMDNIVRHAGYMDLYDTVTYTYSPPNNPPSTPSKPSGPTVGYERTWYSYYTSTTDPDGDNVRYEFDWGDGKTTWTDWYASGATAKASHSWAYAGTYYVKVRAQDSKGAYSGWSQSLQVVMKVGCPTLFVWNGSEYVEEGVLNIHADSDVTVQHRIEGTLVPDGYFYMLSLRELDEFTSHIDYVKLYAVNTNGEWYNCYLVKAVHSELGYVTAPLLFDDNRRVNLTPQQTIDLTFLPPQTNEIAYFIFEINGYNAKIE
jgi:hypothetical protein